MGRTDNVTGTLGLDVICMLHVRFNLTITLLLRKFSNVNLTL